MTEATGKKNYKKTLNLPQTSFPMRASLTANEPASLKRWEAMGLYDAVQAARRDGEPFVFHDGPPYANGLIHVGHLLNKVLKDFVVRTRLMDGRACPYVPGWDCHGLPIEHRVMTELVKSGKADKLAAMPDDQRRMAIRRRCSEYAHKHVELQARQMRRLLTLADYDHPYLTLTPDYEQAVLEVFAGLVEQGLVYRALKSVHWSIENQTALAEAELEYHDRQDTSVYVDFEATDRDAVGRIFGVELDQTPTFMIWTTTPWTLPANLAVAVHERLSYALAHIDGNIAIVARDLLERVTEAAGSATVKLLGEAPGSALVGLTYRQPLNGRVCPIVAAEYVTVEDGTGLVHTAPGHGDEDYQTALREGLEIYCPVLADGTYDDTVPDWLVGMSIWKANDAIVEWLRTSGHLYHDHRFTHSYPHDWRSQTPVIFRATEQWFIGVDRPTVHGGRTLRQLALKATASGVTFVPEWGRNRMQGMLETRPDWCLSRQRSWGLPIPAFETADGEVLLTAATVRAVAARFAEAGSDAWFSEAPEALLAGYDHAADDEAPESVRRGGVAGLKKMYDIFDVWFESGSSWHAAMRSRGRGFPIDLYLEGSDQHRGWFQLSLLPALAVTGQSPFRAVLTHGFTVDKDGRKMSKSVGNAIEVNDVLDEHGADVCRWWVSSLAYENDVKMDMSFLADAGETYRKVRNTLRFLLSNLADLPRDGAVGPPSAVEPASVHAWVLASAAELDAQVRDAYERYAFRRAHHLLYDFCNETLSALYCAAVKDRLYCDRPDAPRRRAAQWVMRELADWLCRLLAPILPHTADEAYRAMRAPAGGGGGGGGGAGGSAGGADDATTVHVETFRTPGPAVEPDPAWARVMAVRDDVLKTLEAAKARGVDNPLDAEVRLPDDGTLARVIDDLPDVLGVSRVTLVEAGAAIEVTGLHDQPRCDRCWRRDPTTRPRGDGGDLCDRCADAVGSSCRQ